MSDYTSKIRDWLEKSGYPLEMQVAKGLQKAGFGVVQSEYFEDEESSKWRETDVIGYEEHRSETCRALFSLIVECKGGKDKPWVLFTCHDNYPSGLSISRRASSDKGDSILRVLALKDEVKSNPLFSVPDRPGYSLTVANIGGGNSDVAYNALQSVCKASLGLINRIDNLPFENIIPFAWPVIVINAPLYESYLDDDGEVQISEITEGLLIWKNPVIARHTFVHVYTRDKFLDSVESIRQNAIEYMKHAAEENDRSPRTEESS